MHHEQHGLTQTTIYDLDYADDVEFFVCSFEVLIGYSRNARINRAQVWFSDEPH